MKSRTKIKDFAEYNLSQCFQRFGHIKVARLDKSLEINKFKKMKIDLAKW